MQENECQTATSKKLRRIDGTTKDNWLYIFLDWFDRLYTKWKHVSMERSRGEPYRKSLREFKGQKYSFPIFFMWCHWSCLKWAKKNGFFAAQPNADGTAAYYKNNGQAYDTKKTLLYNTWCVQEMSKLQFNVLFSKLLKMKWANVT